MVKPFLSIIAVEKSEESAINRQTEANSREKNLPQSFHSNNIELQRMAKVCRFFSFIFSLSLPPSKCMLTVDKKVILMFVFSFVFSAVHAFQELALQFCACMSNEHVKWFRINRITIDQNYGH